jgi:isoprenylcysteine carboxyl methyltransferase (ICMT) family protein YpbQ
VLSKGAVENAHKEERVFAMLYTIAVVLVILWLLGMVTSTTMGGFVHVLLAIAAIVILFNFIGGRKHA